MYIRNLIDFKIWSDFFDPDLDFFCVEIKKPGVKPFSFLTGIHPAPIRL